MATWVYAGSNLPAPVGQNGIFLCAQANGTANDSYGVVLQYSDTGSPRTEDIIDDSVAIAFMGRNVAASQYGQYQFKRFKFNYLFPKTETVWGDGATSKREGIYQIMLAGHGRGKSANGVFQPCKWQDADGYVYTGLLQDVSFEVLVNPSGWVRVQGTFTQTA